MQVCFVTLVNEMQKNSTYPSQPKPSQTRNKFSNKNTLFIGQAFNLTKSNESNEPDGVLVDGV